MIRTQKRFTEQIQAHTRKASDIQRKMGIRALEMRAEISILRKCQSKLSG
jgi:hypothetical protein